MSAYPTKSYGKTDTLARNEWTFYNTTLRSDLVGLHPGTLYNVSVWAITSNGTSEPSTEYTWTEVGGKFIFLLQFFSYVVVLIIFTCI